MMMMELACAHRCGALPHSEVHGSGRPSTSHGIHLIKKGCFVRPATGLARIIVAPIYTLI